MANTKVTSAVIADDAITSAKIDSTSTGMTFADLTVTGEIVTSDGLTIENSSGATLNINTNAGATDAKILLHEGTTASPANGASIRYDGANNIFKIGVGSSVDTTRLSIDRATGDISFYEDTGTTAKLFWDASAESLGIGTSSPASMLHLSAGVTGVSGGEAAAITLTNKFDSPDNSWTIKPQRTGVSNTGLEIRDVTDSRSDMSFDGSGNIGIGSSSPSHKLSVAGVIEAEGATELGSSNTGACFLHYSTNNYSYFQGAYGANGVFFSEATGSTRVGMQSGQVMTFETNAAERLRIDGSGSVLIGKTTTNSNVEGIILSSNDFIQATRSGGICFSANRRDSTGTIQNFEYNGGTVGTISVSTSSTSYNTTSDYRLKENVDYDFNALERVAQLKPARFNFIVNPDETVDGFLAHEVQDIVPEAIHGVKDEMQEEEYEVTPAELDEEGNVVTEAVMGTREVPKYQGIDQSKLVPLLTKAIQEQQTIIDDLKARIETLENA